MSTDAAPRYIIEPLGKQHDRAAFSCGVEPLDRYFKLQAGQESRRHIANCFVAVDRTDNSIAGFYTLSATSVTFDGLPEGLRKKLPRYPDVPAALVGRLARNLRHRGQGVGRRLIVDAMRRTLAADLAATLLVVDAKDDAALRFYREIGFLDIGPGRSRLYMPVAEIGESFGASPCDQERQTAIKQAYPWPHSQSTPHSTCLSAAESLKMAHATRYCQGEDYSNA
ncbi:MAG: GNAT family N-acetyltransferase [Rhodomicrobiaceae bacterium]